MLNELGLNESVKFFSFLMLSFAFFIGIMLTVSQDAYIHFNKALQREFGIRKRFVPGIEDKHINFIDLFLLKFRLISGIVISVSAFILLLLYKL